MNLRAAANPNTGCAGSVTDPGSSALIVYMFEFAEYYASFRVVFPMKKV